MTSRGYFFFGSWQGPTVSDSNLWPDSDYSHIVCSLEVANACPTVMLVPRMQKLPDGSAPKLRVCRRSAPDAIADCAAYTISSNFIYQSAVPKTRRLLSQTALSSWSILALLEQVKVPPYPSW